MAASLLAGSRPAMAEGDEASSRTVAVQLFDEAEALLAKSQYAKACPKYAESYRLDPQLGVLLYLAECYERNGQLASAWGSFRDAEDIARRRRDARAQQAAARAAALRPRLSYVVVRVAANLPGLEVLRDGVPIARVLWGEAVAVDPGRHEVAARAPAHRDWKANIIVAAEGGSTTVDVPRLVGEPASAPERTSAGAASASFQPEAGRTSRRIAAIAVGGLGIVGVGVGGFFGLSAQASLSDSKDLCNDRNYCTARGSQLASSAQDKALIASVSTGIGASALVVAAVLWFTAPDATGGARAATPPRREWALAPARSAWGAELTRAF